MDLKTSTRHCSAAFSGKAVLAELPPALYQLMNAADVVYALEYEALRLNPVFLDLRPGRRRSLKGETQSRIKVQKALEGSSLWLCGNTSLSGSISMKSSCAVHGAVRDSLDEFEEWVRDYGKTPGSQYTLTGIAIALDMINLSMGHLSKLITNRLMRLTNPSFSGLADFPGQAPQIRFDLQSRISSIDAAAEHLSAPCSLYRPAGLGGAENLNMAYHNALITALSILELLYELLAAEAFYCMKIFELRLTKPDGAYTYVLYEKMKGVTEGTAWEMLFHGDTICELIRLLEMISFDSGR